MYLCLRSCTTRPLGHTKLPHMCCPRHVDMDSTFFQYAFLLITNITVFLERRSDIVRLYICSSDFIADVYNRFAHPAFLFHLNFCSVHDSVYQFGHSHCFHVSFHRQVHRDICYTFKLFSVIILSNRFVP